VTVVRVSEDRRPWNERIGWDDVDRANAAADRLLLRIRIEAERERISELRRQTCLQCGARRGLNGCQACRGAQD
jgi:hypothetical protein